MSYLASKPQKSRSRLAFVQRRLSLLTLALLMLSLVGTPLLLAQKQAFDPLSKSNGANLLVTPTLTPGTAFLFSLEKKFAAAVAEGGGPAFASFFDKNAVTIGNKTAMQIGQAAIAAQATWSPKDYQLMWKPEGGEMSPDGDMGYTWGHYEGRATTTPNQSVQHGRYMTIWKKEPDGTWKVVLDSSNEDAPNAAFCTCSPDAKP